MSKLEDTIREQANIWASAASRCGMISDEVARVKQNLAELEVKQQEKREHLLQVETEREKVIAQYLTQQLLQNSAELAQRSKAFYTQKTESSALFEPEALQKDQRVIQVYEKNQDIPEITQSLQTKYQEAKKRENARQEYRKALDSEITATIVWKQLPEGKAEIYLPVASNSTEDGLGSNLAEVVAEVILDPKVKFDGPEDYHGIQKIVLQEAISEFPGETISLQSLKRKTPKDFVEAKINYNVLVIRPLPQREDGLIGTDHLADVPLGHISRREDKRVKDGAEVEVSSNPEEYIPVRQARAYSGLSHLTFYPHLDINQGPLPTICQGRTRLVHRRSLEEFIAQKYGPIKWYTVKEAAEEWKNRIERELGEEQKEVDSYNSNLHSRISHKEIAAVKTEDGKLAICERELQGFLINYLARKKMEKWDTGNIPRDEFVKIVPMEYHNHTILAKQGKLVLTSDYQAVTLDSAKTFLKDHHYNGRMWAPKHIERIKKCAN